MVMGRGMRKKLRKIWLFLVVKVLSIGSPGSWPWLGLGQRNRTERFYMFI